jgi:hypothetical protein
VTPVDPIGPVDVRPRPVERALPALRPRRPDDKRDPERDPRRRDRRPEAKDAPEDGHVDVRA